MHIAQLNIAKAISPLDDPIMQEFVENLEQVNAIAEASPGFIWRLQDESGDATKIQAFSDPNLIINMSVWETIESLKDFIFKTQHVEFLKRKTEWFEKIPEANHVLWWIPVGTVPTIDDAIKRLMYLREKSASSFAFDFRNVFNK
jgi:hypothetical protein